MGRRFAPVPYDAIDCADSPTEAAFILWLFQQAHTARWRPLRFRERRWASEHSLTRYALGKLLQRLDDEGLIKRTIDKTKKRAEGSTVVVFNPCEASATDSATDSATEGEEEAEELTEAQPPVQPRDQPPTVYEPETENLRPTESDPEQEDQRSRTRPPLVSATPPLGGQHASPPPRWPRHGPNLAAGAAGARTPQGAGSSAALPPGSTGSLDADYAAVCATWRETVRPALGLSSVWDAPPLRAPGAAALVVSALGDPTAGLSKVLDACSFLERSPGAAWHRDNPSRVTFATLAKHIYDYAQKWRDHGDKPAPEVKRRSSKPPRKFTAFDDAWEERFPSTPAPQKAQAPVGARFQLPDLQGAPHGK